MVSTTVTGRPGSWWRAPARSRYSAPRGPSVTRTAGARSSSRSRSMVHGVCGACSAVSRSTVRSVGRDCPRLALVDEQEVDAVAQALVQGRLGSGVEDDRRPSRASQPGRFGDRRYRDLQLHEKHVRRGDRSPFRRPEPDQLGVRAGVDDDGILAGRVDDHHREAGPAVRPPDESLDAFRGEDPQQLLPLRVRPDRPDKPGASPGPGRSDRLVQALATRTTQPCRPEHRLPGPRQLGYP